MTLLDDIRTDMSPKKGTLTGALICFCITIIIFVVIPYALFAVASGSPGGGMTFIGDADGLEEGVWGWVTDMMKYAFPMVLLSVFIGFYRAGSYARIPFKVLFALYLATWLWIASHGGVFTFQLVSGGMTSVIEFDVRYIAYVLIMISFAMLFLTFSEFGGNRKKYLEALERKKDTMSKRKARRLSG
ncbi:MAG: hypothetical protein FWD81_04710 [Methanomassiliicoccaceae archaeon]|nr:hypothetical protein [Methanomassiliicoccaceae archaeon]